MGDPFVHAKDAEVVGGERALSGSLRGRTALRLLLSLHDGRVKRKQT